MPENKANVILAPLIRETAANTRMTETCSLRWPIGHQEAPEALCSEALQSLKPPHSQAMAGTTGPVLKLFQVGLNSILKKFNLQFHELIYLYSKFITCVPLVCPGLGAPVNMILERWKCFLFWED